MLAVKSRNHATYGKSSYLQNEHAMISKLYLFDTNKCLFSVINEVIHALILCLLFFKCIKQLLNSVFCDMQNYQGVDKRYHLYHLNAYPQTLTQSLSIISYSWWFGVQCFFGGAGCDSKCGVRGTMFVLMYTLGYIGTANLTRFSEGATYVAVVYVSHCHNCDVFSRVFSFYRTNAMISEKTNQKIFSNCTSDLLLF